MPENTNNANDRLAAGGLLAPPPGTAEWITAELIAETIEVWDPFYQDELTVDDAIEILTNVGLLAELLVEKPDTVDHDSKQIAS